MTRDLPPQDASQYDTVRAFPTGDKSSSMLLVEATGPKQVRLQRESSYQMKVTNLTDMPVTNVILSSTNPDGFKVTPGDGMTAQAVDDSHSGYAIGTLAPKESKTIRFTGMATKPGSVDTCYTVRCDPPKLCTMVEVINPAIALAVLAPADTDICKPVTYTYTVTNTGTGTAHDVMLQEDLPDGLMTTDGKQSVAASLGDIPQGQNRSATAQLKAARTGSFTGSAIAKSDGDSSPAAQTVTAVHAPALAVAVTGGKESEYVGTPIGFQIVVTNKGDATARNAKVLVAHTTGLGTLSVPGCDANGVVALGDIEPNGSKTVTATAGSDQGGTMTVTANTSADCASPVSGSGQTVFNTIPALLLETVDEADPGTVGQNVIYDIKVTNQGSGPDNNVNVKAVVPDGEQYVSTDGPTQPTVDGSTLTFPAITTLKPKESVTWKVTVKAVKAGDVQFKTAASCDGTAPAEKTEPTKLVDKSAH